MAAKTLEELAGEYEQLYGTMVIAGGRLDDADAIINKIVKRKNVYEAIMQVVGVPWQIIGVLHSMESSLNFTTHLHNGDPLTARTVRAPKGRPKTGSPPFTFAESAVDALRMEGLANLTDWGLAATLFRLEKYNGFGFRKHKIHTPYLWSFSNHYQKGKFVEVKEGGSFVSRFDPDLVSQQCGAAVLLVRMVDREIFAFSGLPRSVEVVVNAVPRPSVSAFVHKGNSWIAPRLLAEFVPGLSVAAVNMVPFKITLAYHRPGTPPDAALDTRDFDGRMFHGHGHVDASDLVRDFLRLGLDFTDATKPNRLLITT